MDAEIARWGRFAQRALEAEEGRVVAVFERSLYVETAAGLACLGEIGAGPLNATCQPVAARVGDKVRRIGGELFIGANAVRLEHAMPWSPPQGKIALDLARVATLCAGGGLARAAIALASGAPLPTDEPLLRLAAPAIEALRNGDLDGATPLLGLGPGLTPSGDDLLGGFMIVAGDARIAQWALARAPHRTCRISAAHLAAAAEGEAAAVFHEALLGGPLEPLVALGHSSGWDMLTGAVLALTSGR